MIMMMVVVLLLLLSTLLLILPLLTPAICFDLAVTPALRLTLLKSCSIKRGRVGAYRYLLINVNGAVVGVLARPLPVASTPWGRPVGGSTHIFLHSATSSFNSFSLIPFS